MEIEYTNFEGNWEADCPYCGKPQESHKVDLGAYEGKQYIHRSPCEEEQYVMRKNAVKKGIVIRTIVNIYSTLTYLWGLIPFKEEIKLLFGFIKNIFVSLRAMWYLQRSKPKHNKNRQKRPRDRTLL